MSVWTYVTGVLVFGQFNPIYQKKKFDEVNRTIRNCLGKMVDFNDMISGNEEDCITIMPMGSEGTFEYEITDSGFIIFYGSLRDFHGESDIKILDDYFKDSFDRMKEEKIYVDEYLIKAWNRLDGEKIWKYDSRYENF